MYTDPFASLPDPFASLGGPGRRRGAQFPALPEEEARSAIGSLTDNALSGLGYVGSLLDKMTGARAIRGTLGGHPREALSLLPFSDSLGITDPAQITSGETLLEDAGVIGPNDPNAWEVRDFLGPAAEIAMDPATYFGGVGALTKAGKLAQKGGTLTKGLLPAVAAGQRSIHPLLALASPATQAAAGALPGKLASLVNVGVRNLPGVGPAAGAAIDYGGKVAGAAKVGLRAKFDPLAGFVPEATVQAAHEGAYLPARRAATEAIKGSVFDRYQELRPLLDAGVDPGELDRYLTQRIEGVAPGLRAGGAPGPHLGTLGPHLATIDPIADRMRAQYGQLRSDELAQGLRSPALDSLYDLDYAARQATKAPGGEPAGAVARLFGTAHASQRARKAIFDLPGGTAQLQDVIRDPTMSLAARIPAGRKVVASKLWDLLAEPYGGAAALGPGGVPLAPDVIRRMEAVRKGLPGYLARVKDEFIDVPGRAEPAVPFFKGDAVANLLRRGERSAGAMGGAAAVYDTIGRAGAVASGPGMTPVLRSLTRGGLQGEAAREHALRALKLDPAAILAQAQAVNPAVDPKMAYGKALAPYALPDATADAATKLATRYATPAEVAPGLKALDSGMAAIKNLLYTIFPSSHVRNVYSGLAENALEAGMSPRDPAYGDAVRSLMGEGIVTGLPGHSPLSPAEQRLALVRELYVQGIVDPLQPQGAFSEAVGARVPVLGGGDPALPRTGWRGVLKGAVDVPGALRDPMGMQGVSGTLKDPFDLAGKGPRAADTNPMVAAGKAVGRTSEDLLRSAEYLALRRGGSIPAAARDAVLRTHLDYVGGLSDFERNVMRRLVPFYTFSRLNIPKQVRRAVERPATVQVPVRAADALKDESTYTPNYLASGLAVPLGAGDAGETRFLSQVGLPFEEAFGHLKVGRNAVDTATQTAMNLAASLRPEVRLGLEQIAGKQFYTGRELKDLRPGNLATGFGIFSDDTARLLAQFISNSPATRLASTAERLMDPRKWADPFTLPLSLATGAKLTDVDTAKWRAIDARRQVEALLDAMPHVAESRDFYARPEQKGQLTAEEVELLRLQAYIKEKARAAAKAKRVGVFGG